MSPKLPPVTWVLTICQPLILSFEERGIGEVTEVLNATEKDLAEANEIAQTFSLEDAKRVCSDVLPDTGAS